MKNNFSFLFKNSYVNYFIFALLISLVLFRGRLGSDDLEVFNYIFDFHQFEGSLLEFFRHLSSENRLFYDDTQKHSYYTTLHRFTWLTQTGIIYFVTYKILSLFDLNNFFIIQYFSGYVLTFISIISIFLFNKILQEKNLNATQSIFLSLILFFGTSLIFTLTGQYIESLSILLILCYIYFSNIYLKFFLGFLLLFTKPFYILVILGLRSNKLNSKNFYINLSNINNFKDVILLIFFYLSFFFLISFFLGKEDFILSYFFIQGPTFDFILYFKNLINFYFAPGAGLIFSLLIPVLLIFFGLKKNTILKILIVLLISLMLSLWKGSHGGIPGSRYILPFLFMFIDEYVLAINYLSKRKNKFLIILLFVISFLNLPSLEYRNLAITEYSSGTINTMKPLGPAKIITDPDKEFTKYAYFDWPINNFKFNSIYFGNYIIISKILGKKKLSINNIDFNTRNVYPQTGFARLIYIKNKQINIEHEIVTNILQKYHNYFFYLYVFVIISFIFFILRNLKKMIKLSD